MNHPRCHPAFVIADALVDAARIGYISCRDNGGRLRRVLHRRCRSCRCSKAHSHLATPPTLHQPSALWGVVMRGYSSSSTQYPHDSGLRKGCQVGRRYGRKGAITQRRKGAEGRGDTNPHSTSLPPVRGACRNSHRPTACPRTQVRGHVGLWGDTYRPIRSAAFWAHSVDFLRLKFSEFALKIILPIRLLFRKYTSTSVHLPSEPSTSSQLYREVIKAFVSSTLAIGTMTIDDATSVPLSS